MLKETTVSKLHEMRLTAMAELYRNQLQDSSFNALRNALVSWWILNGLRRKNNKLTKLIRKADFQLNDACTENIEYHPDRKLDKTQIARLSTCSYVQENHNLVIMGASGSGKTYLACAFGIAA